MEKYDTLLLSSGGVKGLYMLGVLHYLYEVKNLTIHKFIGTSVGAVLGYLLAIGYTPFEILATLIRQNIFKKMSKNMRSISEIVDGQGIFNYEIIHKSLQEFTMNKIGKYITLKQLHAEYHKELICVTYNLTLRKVEYMSYKTNPNLPCLIALRMSSNIPTMFEPFKYTNSYYIDGAYSNDFAVECLEENNKAFGIYLNPVEGYTNFTNQIQYIIQSIIIPLNILSAQQRKKADHQKNLNIIDIPTNNDCMEFKITITTILNKFSKGYSIIKEKIKFVRKK